MTPITGHCRECDYPLVRLTANRCPECGTPFDPEDPGTMNFHPSRVVRFLEKPTTFWTLFPAFLTLGVAFSIGLTVRREEVQSLCALASLAVLMGTLYVVMARQKFRSFLRKRQVRRP